MLISISIIFFISILLSISKLFNYAEKSKSKYHEKKKRMRYIPNELIF